VKPKLYLIRSKCPVTYRTVWTGPEAAQYDKPDGLKGFPDAASALRHANGVDYRLWERFDETVEALDKTMIELGATMDRAFAATRFKSVETVTRVSEAEVVEFVPKDKKPWWKKLLGRNA
jgi:hypothetical protein